MDLAAFAVTRAGVELNKRKGKYAYNLVNKATGGILSRRTVRAEGYGTTMEFPALDNYGALLFMEEAYEPDMFALLWALRIHDFAFVDGGANLGYWSALVSGLKIRPSPRRGNRSVDDDIPGARQKRPLEWRRVRVRARGVVLGGRGDRDLRRISRACGARKITGASTNSLSTSVITTTIDDMVARRLPDQQSLVIKLDVEGAEGAALEGSRTVITNRDCLFIAEEHGADSDHLCTKALLSEDLIVWTLADDGTARPLADLDQLTAIKTNVDRGYNVAAHRAGSELAAKVGLTTAAHEARTAVQLTKG